MSLTRKTSMRRSPGKLMRRTCLKRISPAKAAMQREYAQVTEASRERQISDRGYTYCERCEKACTPERHHTQGRVGRNLLVFVWLCAKDHEFIHSHTKIARQEGWLK